jgi:hypothetical protein
MPKLVNLAKLLTGHPTSERVNGMQMNESLLGSPCIPDNVCSGFDV